MSEHNPNNQPLAAEATTLCEQNYQRLDLAALGLSAADYAEVYAAAQQLQAIDPSVVAEYGKDIAQQTSVYTDDLLKLVQSKDLQDTGVKLTELLSAAQQLNHQQLLSEERKSGFLGVILAKFKGAKQSFQLQYNSAKAQIDQLLEEIEVAQNGLKQRVEMLDQMYLAVQQEHHALGVYIAAGQLKQQQLAQQINQLSEQQQVQQVVQQVYDLNHSSNNLDKRLHDFQMLQQSALQTLPMIRIIQSNNLMLVDKFYAIKNITIPAWKNQISLALSLNEQKHSVELAKNIDDATNELLKRNAELLHSNSVNTAKANQRAVIDVETLQHVQNTLHKTVQDVIQIQKQGMAERDQATQTLKQLQLDLNQLVIASARRD